MRHETEVTWSADDMPSQPHWRDLYADTVTPRSTAQRWALWVVSGMYSEYDLKTLGHWAKCVNVSRSALCGYCRLLGMTPSRARDFTRVMRAIHQCGERFQPEAVMDVADSRTMRRLLDDAGLNGVTRTPSWTEFVARQHWIAHDNPGLAAVCVLLSRGCSNK